MPFPRRAVALAACMSLAGCYHAIVDTGRPPSNVTVEKEGAPGFLWGLVAPDPLDVAGKCTSGVSKFETVHSFVDGLLGTITLGIYTPMDIKVTCAAGTAEAPHSIDAAGTSAEARQAAMDEAVRLAIQTDQPVLVRF